MNTTSGIITMCYWPSGVAGQDGFLINLHTGRQLTQGDYTRSCIHTIVLLRMIILFLETCGGFK